MCVAQSGYRYAGTGGGGGGLGLGAGSRSLADRTAARRVVGGGPARGLLCSWNPGSGGGEDRSRSREAVGNREQQEEEVGVEEVR